MRREVPDCCNSEKRAVYTALDLTIDYSTKEYALKIQAGFSFNEVRHHKIKTISVEVVNKSYPQPRQFLIRCVQK